MKIDLSQQTLCEECGKVTLPYILGHNGGKCYSCSDVKNSWEFKRLDRPQEVEEKYCILHRCELKEGTASVSYGLQDFSRIGFFLRSNFYPVSRIHVWGGCTLPGPGKIELKYCWRCRLSEGFIMIFYAPIFAFQILGILALELIHELLLRD